MEDLVTIAKIVKTRGLRGELVADILTDFPDRFDHLKKVFVVKPSGETLELEIEKFWFQKGRIIFKFVGLNSIEEAENFRDCGVCIAEDETAKKSFLPRCETAMKGGQNPKQNRIFAQKCFLKSFVVL